MSNHAANRPRRSGLHLPPSMAPQEEPDPLSQVMPAGASFSIAAAHVGPIPAARLQIEHATGATVLFLDANACRSLAATLLQVSAAIDPPGPEQNLPPSPEAP